MSKRLSTIEAVDITKDKKAYRDLIEKVYAIDVEAGEYLRYEAAGCGDFRYNGLLANCFIWSDTPQGREYWRNIHNTLEPEDKLFE